MSPSRCADLYPGWLNWAGGGVGDRVPDSLHRPDGPRLSGVGDCVRPRRVSVD